MHAYCISLGYTCTTLSALMYRQTHSPESLTVSPVLPLPTLAWFGSSRISVEAWEPTLAISMSLDDNCMLPQSTDVDGLASGNTCMDWLVLEQDWMASGTSEVDWVASGRAGINWLASVHWLVSTTPL